MSLEDDIIEKLEVKYPISDEIGFNEYNIAEKLQNHAFLLIKYNRLLLKEKQNLEKLQEILNKVTGEKYHFYRFNFDEQLTKTEIEKYYLPKEPEIIKVQKLIQKQEIIVGFFETAVKALEAVGWNMKNFLDASRQGI